MKTGREAALISFLNKEASPSSLYLSVHIQIHLMHAKKDVYVKRCESGIDTGEGL